MTDDDKTTEPQPTTIELGGGPRRSWKDLAIAGLSVVVLLLGGLLARDRLSAAGWFAGAPAGDEVRLFDLILDRRDLAYIDLLFDRPIGEGREGEILSAPPATLSPAVGGTWRWRDSAVLRFEPSDRLPMATEYTIALILDRLLAESQSFAGDTTLTLRTDQFVVEAVDVAEDPVPDAPPGTVVLRGEVRFNYPVEPAELAPRLALSEAAGEPVELFLETTYPSSEVGFRSAAVRKAKAERTLTLTVAGDLTPAYGNVPLAGDAVHEVALGSIERLRVRRLEAEPGERESTLTLTFSSPVTAESAARFVEVAPEVDYRLSTSRNELRLVGPFLPGQQYAVSVRAGLPATDGAVLGEAFRADQRLPNLEPSVRFESDGMFLSASGARSLAIESVNVGRIHLAVDRVYRNNLFSLFQYQRHLLRATSWGSSSVQRALGDRLTKETLTVRAERNRRHRTPLRLDRYLDGQKPGFYRVTVWRDRDYSAEQRWVLITDLGMIAKRGDGELAVWVHSFADLSPTAGARVQIVSDQNQVLAERRTDGGGFVRFAGEAVREGSPYLLVAETASDFSFLLFDASAVDLAGLDVGGAAARRSGYDAFLYGERDLYRPGERLEGLAIVRDRDLGVPPAMPALLRHRGPNGSEQAVERLTIEDGIAELGLELPAYSRTGRHSLELEVAEKVIGRYGFQIEEFVPDRIKVEIAVPGAEAPAGGPGPGETLGFEVSSAYLFGPPASGLPVDTRVRLEPAPFRPPGYEAYVFANPERSFDGLEIFRRTGELDGAGRRGFEATVPSGLTVASSLVAQVTARVSEKGGRGVTATRRVPVHPVATYVGLRRLEEGYAEPGEEVAFSWVAVAPDGSPGRAGSLRAELFHDRWNTLLRRTPEGGFRYESVRDPVLVESKALAGGEAGELTLRPPEYGAYRAVLTDLSSGASAQVELYASGWGYAPWAIKSPGRVELDLDRESYPPGSTAAVQVRSPFPGRLLLTVEREGLLHYETFRLDGNTARVELPVPESYRPNVYVTATVVRSAGDLEPGSPGRAFGAVPLAVDRESKRLTLGLAAPEEMRPRSPLEVEVTAAPGSVVTVSAVDEGILQLISQQTPDPFAHFYRKLALGVRSFDTFGLLLPEVAESPAGGDFGVAARAQYLSASAMRRREPVALWSGVLRAGSDGRARARFEVPELQGRLRLTAVGARGDRFGSATGEVRVRDRVVLLPTLPRFLQTGDRLDLPVTVRNDTGRDGTFEVRLELAGDVATATSSRLEVEVADGAEELIYFPLAVGDRIGELGITLTARGNGENTLATAELGVRSPLPAASRVEQGILTAGETVLAAASADLVPGTVRRTVRIGPTPIVRLADRLESLLGYPYGCLEQTVSRVFPLVYFGDLAKRLAPDLFAETEPELMVEEGIRRLATLQRANGGFGMWPRASTAAPWPSLYAAHFLVEADRAGFGVSYSLREGALDYAATGLSAKVTYTESELRRMAYALYVLALADRADRGTMDFLRQRHADSLPADARALLAAAYAALGEPSGVAALASEIADVERVERQSGADLGSTLRNRALLLLAMLDADPEHPRLPELADRIAREAEASGVWTTQESAFAFLALGKLFRRQADKGAYSGSLLAGGRRVGTFDQEPVAFSGLTPAGELTVRLDSAAAATGPVAYYSVETRGVPTAAAFRPAAEGLEIERSFFRRDGGRADLAAVEQGDLVVMRLRVRSTSGPVDNVVVSALLPSGLEVENPRLETTEGLGWIRSGTPPEHLDLRDDRILAFVDLPENGWRTLHTLLRAVTPGRYPMPPAQAEAMYNPALRATGAAGSVTVARRE